MTRVLTLFVIALSLSIVVEKSHANSLSRPELSNSGTPRSKSTSTELEGVNFGSVQRVLTFANEEPHKVWCFWERLKAAAATSLHAVEKSSSQRHRRILVESDPGDNPPPTEDKPGHG